MLHAGCTYLLRLGIAVWLAASVAGLVVVAQQAECLPEGTDAGFWKVGISCGIHRTVFIVAVVSLYVLPPRLNKTTNGPASPSAYSSVPVNSAIVHTTSPSSACTNRKH